MSSSPYIYGWTLEELTDWLAQQTSPHLEQNRFGNGSMNKR